MKKIPVTVLSGFLGSGKTTVLNHILETKRDQKVALIVNDMAEVNVDGRQVGDRISKTEEKLVEIQDGCICCTLREDLFLEVKKIAEEGKYDYLIIESSGISEPLPVAATFTFDIEEGSSLKDLAQLDTMVTVVDAHNFINEYNSTESLKDRKQEVGEDDDRNVIDLMIDQLEFANVIVVNKTDLVDEEELKRVHQTIRSVNAEAKIVDTVQGNVDLKDVMNTGLFDFEEAQSYPTWIKEMQRDNEHTPESEEYGISSFIYRAQRPFIPELFVKAMRQRIPGLLRAKGLFWLCTRMDYAGNFQLAGRLKEYTFAGDWWAAVPKEEWSEGVEEMVKPIWDETFGDRRQEIVFIGIDLDQEEITKQLDACLLTDEQLKEDYQNYPDPLPEWRRPEEE